MSKRKSGFEYDGKFYPFEISDKGRDVFLIDRITGMPLQDVFAEVKKPIDEMRTPVFFALVATSIRAKRTDWSLERILRIADELSYSEILESIVGGDQDEEATERPPGEGEGSPAPSPKSSGSPGTRSRRSRPTSASSGKAGPGTSST